MNRISVIVSRGGTECVCRCCLGIVDCDRCGNTVGIRRGQEENVWEGTDDESAVGSIQLHYSEPLPYPSHCVSLCALWVQMAS